METDEEKTFTLQEAESLLPELKTRIARLRELRRAMEEKAPVLAVLAKRARENAGSSTGTRYLLELMEFEAGVKRFAELGCVLRDLERGLLDFAAIVDGRKVFLCWAWGEETIEWWHDLNAGVNGR